MSPPCLILDIATARPSFPNRLYTVRFQTVYYGTFISGNENTRLGYSWRYFNVPDKANKFNSGNVEMGSGGLMIKAVATLEPRCSIQKNDHVQLEIDSRSLPAAVHQSSSEDSTDLDEGEKLRRMRISKANRGKTPWNKGRKHSPETLQRIKERTRLAMQDPKVKKKLVNLGHAQSEETRIKIGVGVRIGWEKRHEKLMLQETCHFDWQNLIAEASRRGFLGEEELQWDSYQILDEQLEQEWLESVEQRKKMPRPKGSKRAPKSFEQRRKISEAIAAKWADPTYRDRVYSGLSKYHGTPIGIAKPKRRATSDRQPRKTSPTKKTNGLDNSVGNAIKSQKQQSKLKRSNVPLYKDPLASSKLEMIKNIRAQRAAAERTKSEAITRAKVLIAEAERAAEALGIAAEKSPLAHASLIETRKLIAEAIKSIESIESGHVYSHANGRSLSFTSSELTNNVEKETDAEIEDLSRTGHNGVNGLEALALSDRDIKDFGFGELNLQDLLYCKDDDIPSSSHDHDSVNGKEQLYLSASHASLENQFGKLELNGSNQSENMLPKLVKSESEKQENGTKTKRWVRGKLVEGAEEED